MCRFKRDFWVTFLSQDTDCHHKQSLASAAEGQRRNACELDFDFEFDLGIDSNEP